MPQASKELRAKFPGSDREALDVLAKHFTAGDTKHPGRIQLRNQNYQPTQREWDAITYLVHEWDYSWTGK